MKKHELLILMLIVCICIPMTCFGDDAADDLKKTIENMAVPESPAFAILGVTPDKIARPANGRELAFGILQGLDEKGNMQNGLAIDFSPYQLSVGKSITLNQYRNSPYKRILYHTQISTGTSKGSSTDDKSSKLAAGLKVTVFNYGDPRMDLELGTCIQKAEGSVLAKYTPIPLGTPAEQILAIHTKMKSETEEMAEVCREQSSKKNLNKPALDIGVSPVWSSPDGDTKNLDWGGLAVWSSFKYGYEDLLAILNIKYRSKDQRTDPTNLANMLEGETVSVGGKFRYGSISNALLLQGVFSQYEPKGQKKIDEFLYSVGGEIKIADNLWLQASAGSTTGNSSSKPLFVTSQIKWAISETASLK